MVLPTNKTLIKKCKKLILELSTNLMSIRNEIDYTNNGIKIKDDEKLKELLRIDAPYILQIMKECESEE